MPRILNEEIISIDSIAKDIFKMIIKSQYTVQNAKPGQFVNIKCADGLDAYLRRPISICSVNKADDTVTVVFQVKGKGTKLLSEKKPGDTINMIAPLGWGNFSVPENKNVVLVGGGIGIFPLYELAKQLKRNSKNVSVILGFRNKDIVMMEDEFRNVSDKLLISTDDGSYGIKGFTTNLLEEELRLLKADIIYTCGPSVMIKRIAGIAQNNDIECEVSLEERMGCGFGACLACACKTRYGDDWEHSHVCFNGPVFNSKEVIFDD